MGLGVIQAQCHALEMARGAVALDLLQIGASIPNSSNHSRSLDFGPRSRAAQGMPQHRDMRLPSANCEIKVVLPISHRRGVGLFGAGRRRLRCPDARIAEGYEDSKT